MPDRDRVPHEVPDIVQDRAEQLRELFPEAFSEGFLDVEKLRASLGDIVDEAPERYSFTWAGKSQAIRLLQTPTRATLAPAPEESVAFEDTANLFIEGDNLEVLKLLYKSYFGRVKMIYIDPPYNTGNDFVYPDNYADPLDTYLKLTGQRDSDGNLLTSNPETSGRYHSAWLSMMYPRLFLARQLLREDGVIFVSIDDNEVHNLRMLMNEVFGEENFLAAIIWHRIFSSKNTARHFSEDHDYIIAFARDAGAWLPNLLPRSEGADARYSNPDNDPRGPWASGDLTARNYYGEGQYEVTSPSGAVFRPTVGTYWRVSVGKFAELDRDGRVWWGAQGGNMPRLKRFLSEVKQGMVPRTIWHYDEVGHTQEAKQELLAHVLFGDTENVLDTVKPTRLLRRILQLATTPRMGDVVVDFFSGSSGCAQAVLEQNREDGGNRRFIMVQLPEPLPKPEAALRTIADIGKERIRRVIARMKQGDAGKLDLQDREQPEDLGFRVYKLQASNLQGWVPVSADDEAAVREQLQQQLEPLKEGWTEEAVIAEIALKEGFGLSYGTERVEGVGGNVVYRVMDPDRPEGMYVCLDERLSDNTWRGLELSGEDLFVCRDRALTDTQAANLALQCRLHVV